MGKVQKKYPKSMLYANAFVECSVLTVKSEWPSALHPEPKVAEKLFETHL